MREPRRTRCGIYYILNTVNKRVYIGRSTDICTRFNQHRYALRKGGHVNRALQADWLEFGEAAFKFGYMMGVRGIGFWQKRAEAFFVKLYRSNDPRFGYNYDFRLNGAMARERAARKQPTATPQE